MTTQLRRLLAGIVVAAGVLLIGASAAAAQTPEPDAPAGAWFTINNTLVTILTGLIVPIAVGLAMRVENPPWIKATVAVAFAELGNLIQNAIQDDGVAVISQVHALQWAIITATAIGTYLGIYNPLTARSGGLNATLPTVLPPIGTTSSEPVR
jgi:hypothetical protein